MLIKTVGIVIKQREIGERDKIITILTKEMGIIDAYAKGVKSSKNNLTAGTQILAYSEFCLYRGKGGYSVNSCDVINLFYSLRLDVVKLSIALYFCDVINFISPSGKESEIWEIMRFMLNTLHLLENDIKDMRLLKAIFELRIMAMSGFQPNLLGCSKCMCYEHESMYFLPVQGILICKDCLSLENSEDIKYTLSPAILYALRHIVLSDMDKLFKFSLKENALLQLGFICENYTLVRTQTRFKSLEMYDKLKITS